MYPDKVEDLLHSISFLVLDYTDGDLVLISGIIDQFESLGKLFRNDTPEQSVALFLGELAGALIRGTDIPGAQAILSDGTDLLSKITAEISRTGNETVSESLCNEAAQFIKRYRPVPAEKKSPIDEKVPESSALPRTDRTGENVHVNSEAFRIFLVEADDKLVNAQDYILTLEKEPDNKEIINSLFRIFHTIKGECGFLRLAVFGELAHNLENILDRLRNNELKSGPGVISILLEGMDCANEILASYRKGGFTFGDNARFAQLKQAIDREILSSVKKSIGEILVEQGKLSAAEVASILEKQKESAFTRKFGELAIEGNYINGNDLEDTMVKQKTELRPERKQAEAVLDPIIKVNASRINFLVDMIGELLIAENQFDEQDRRVMQLRKITREIQNGAMQLRTTKVKNLFLKMKRVVRDLALELGKQVFMEIVGTELEIDRNMVENLEEPLIHLLRNTVDHGIEKPEERKLKGKPEVGTVILKAERQGNSIVISVEDDGKGLDRDAIRDQAIARRLVTPEDAAAMKDEDIYNFIFVQGFTTAKKIDLVSGRGMGMDIVRAVLSLAKGKVDIKTVKDRFTRFSLVFPLSTAIIDGMIVKSSGTWYIIPVNNIIESLNMDTAKVCSVSGKTKVIDIRQEIIPLINLPDFFSNGNGTGGHKPAAGNGNNNGNSRNLGVIVENSAKRKYALSVDEIVTKKEVVIKPLGKKFGNLRGISSATVLQGGAVGFVLDIDQIVSAASAGGGAGE